MDSARRGDQSTAGSPAGPHNGPSRQASIEDVAVVDGSGRRDPPTMRPAELAALQRMAGNSAVAAWVDGSRRTGTPPVPTMVQRKLEYAEHHAVAPAAAKAAVRADQAGYEAYQQRFERNLGTGLHAEPQAQQGVDGLLLLMRGAMTRAGFSEQKQHESFGIKQKQAGSVDLGSVLVQDVDEALKGGNLREKMGMVYQSRFRIVDALDALRQDKTPGAHDLIGDDMKSKEMGEAIEKEGVGKAAYAVLKRRDSVIGQNKLRGEGKMRALLGEKELDDSGIALSEREKRAAPVQKGGRRFVPGKEFYTIPANIRQAERDNLRAVAAGLSGSTDMYFRIAKHLRMGDDGRRQLRLAALGQMLANEDHSYHEIMHVARTQGELADYPDDLPIGYTTLRPLNADQILGVAKLPDFPGDAQIRSVGVVDTADQVSAAAGGPGKNSHTYPAILDRVRAYHANPSRPQLEIVIAEIDSWLKKKKPGRFAMASTKTKWNQRSPVLEKVRTQCAHLLTVWDSFQGLDPAQVSAFAQQSMQGGDVGARGRMGRLADVGANNDDWYSPEFRAQTSDIDLDTSQMSFKASPGLGLKEDLNANLVTDIQSFVEENRLVMETLGGDVSGVPKMKADPIDPMGMMMAKRKLATEKKAVLDNTQYKTDTVDFTTNIDTSVLDALAPNAPVGGFLKRFEGKPVPQELQAINAYAQPGFYEMMNKILNKKADKKFMASPAGRKWWSEVPDGAKKIVSLSVSALRKMKPYTGGSVYRGENGFSRKDIDNQLKNGKAQREQYWKADVGSSFPYTQFVSTSKRPYSSYIVKEGKYLAEHIDKVKSGVDISAFSNTIYEREVLFPPGTNFKVTKVEDKFGTKADLANKYSEAPIPSSEPGRVKVTLEEV